MVSLELAILYPVVLLIVLSMFQVALYWHTSNSVTAAAEEGFDAGKVLPDDPALAVTTAEAAAGTFLSAVADAGTAGSSTVNAAVSPDGQSLSVVVSADTPLIVGITQWRVESVAEGRFEAFVPADQR